MLSRAVVLLALLAPVARADDELCFTDSVPLTATGWTGSVSIPRFDPALGALTGVQLRVELFSRSTLAFENPSASPQAVTVTQDNLVELERPDGTVMLAVPGQVEVSDTVAAFDGTIDFDGPSGRTVADLPVVRNGATTLTGAADLALFTGTGSVVLPVAGSGSCAGTCACSLVLVCDNASGAEVTVCYAYSPALAIHERDAVPLQPTSWADAVTIRGFDPRWGELEAVGVRLFGHLQGDAAFENFGGAPATATVTADASVDLQLPDGSSGPSVALGGVLTRSLTSYDHHFDYAGPSGWTEQMTAEGLALVVLTDPAAVQAFVTGGSLAFGVAASGTWELTAPPSVLGGLVLQVGADVEVIYVFRPCAAVTHTDVILPSSVAWSSTLSFPRFDPAPGALIGVLLTVIGRDEATLLYESWDSAPADFTLRSDVQLELQDPSAATLGGLDLAVAMDGHATAFDGAIDFGGSSGATLDGLTGAAVRGILLDQAADLAPFVGTGFVTLPATAQAECDLDTTSSSNYAYGCAFLAGLRVDVTYLYTPPVGVASCFGVGCPCANDDPLAGCANSSGSGARLAGSGSPSVACDDLALSVTGAPAGQSGLFFMGDTAVQHPLYDGFQCALGTTWRFLDSVQTTGPTGTASHAGLVAGAGGLIAPGTSWIFQFWYRDAPVSPCGTSANLSNALTVAFVP